MGAIASQITSLAIVYSNTLHSTQLKREQPYQRGLIQQRFEVNIHQIVLQWKLTDESVW